MRVLLRRATLTFAPLLIVGFGLSRLAPRTFTAASAAQEKTAPAGKAARQPGKHAAPAITSASSSSLRGTLSLFGYDSSVREYISTYNAQAKLETIVRHPQQNGRVSEARPRLSPDGKKIAFAETAPDGFNLEVYVMDADGSNVVNLSNNPTDPDAIYRCGHSDYENSDRNFELCVDTWPAWSPDGRHLAFVSGRNGHDEIYVMDADGSHQTLLPSRMSAAPLDSTNPPFYRDDGINGQPVWSPDGTKIAYSYPDVTPPSGGSNSYGTRGVNIAVLTLDHDARGNLIVASDDQLTTSFIDPIAGAKYDYYPEWSPDGAHIAFTRVLGGFFPRNQHPPSYDLFMMGADGSNQVNLTNTPDQYELYPVWSPDGAHIAFTSAARDDSSNDPEDNLRYDNRLVVLDLNSMTSALVPTSSPVVFPLSWVDPCGATPPNTALTESTAKNAADETSSVSAGTVRPCPAGQRRSEGSAFAHAKQSGVASLPQQVSASPGGRLNSTPLPAAQEKTAPAGKSARQSGKHDTPATTSAAASTLRGTLSLFSTDGYSVVGTSYISTYNVQARLETTVGTPRQWGNRDTLVPARPSPRISPDGKKIVYAEVGEDGYNMDVYVMNADGTGRADLSNYPSDPQAVSNCAQGQETQTPAMFYCMDAYPSWSPDGRHIAFISGRSGHPEIYVMNADGTNQTLLPSHLSPLTFTFANDASYPVWSPDGTKIAYSYPTDFEQFWYGWVAFRNELAVLTLGHDNNGNFTVNDDTQLTTSPARFIDQVAPAWSPDGTKIAFSNLDKRGSTGVYDVYLINSDGSNLVNLTADSDRLELFPVWSPDGSQIAFTSAEPDRRNVWKDFRLVVLDLNSSTRTILPTRQPYFFPLSWVDPCGAPSPTAATAGAQAKSAAPSKVKSAASKTASAAADADHGVKCIKEIVVNDAGDDPDADPTNEFCDTDPNKPGNQCTLRAAIQEANARPGPDLITFDIPGDGVHTIAPASELPDITGQVAIDATTQAGYADNAPAVVLSGASAGAANGFNVKAEGVRIAGLVINGFTSGGAQDKGKGVAAFDTSGLRVESCLIGTDATGTQAVPNDEGVFLRNTTDSAVGGDTPSLGNLISGNGLGTDASPGVGVDIVGASAASRGGNSVVGNRIGVDRTGANALANKLTGVLVSLSTNNKIGGETDAPGTAPGNVIAGNNSTNGAGVTIISGTRNTVAGNLVGTDAAGTHGFGNMAGVLLGQDATQNTVGGYNARARNVISGNKYGVRLFGPTVNENYVVGNYVGTDITGQAVVAVNGAADLTQQLTGISVEGGSRNQIGGLSDGAFGNVVAGNTTVQISVAFTDAADNQIGGNTVGLFADGETGPTYSVSGEVGILINGAIRTQIGDDYDEARNVVSGNRAGILVSNSGNNLDAHQHIIGNRVGTNRAGTAARPNTSGGIFVTRSSNNLIEWNVISGNGGAGGISFSNDPPPSSPSFQTAGSFPAANARAARKFTASRAAAALALAAASYDPAKAGGYAAQGDAAQTTNNTARDNYIGTDADGLAAVPNSNGVNIAFGANRNVIGEPDEGNVISGNNGVGVLILAQSQGQAVPTDNKIQSNIIGLDGDASAKLPNAQGGVVVFGGDGTIIGGDAENAGNVIGGNGFDGVKINATSNAVRFNFIGTNRAGAAGLGNARDGVRLEDVTGVQNAIADNTISGNGGSGVTVTNGGASSPSAAKASGAKRKGVARPLDATPNTQITGNRIGVFQVSGGQTLAVPNGASGVTLDCAQNVLIGTLDNAASALKNLISANRDAGVRIARSFPTNGIEGVAATVPCDGAGNNVVNNSIIGTDESGAAGLGNGGDGVRIEDASGNTIGGANTDTATPGNVIAGNGGNGVLIEGLQAINNSIEGSIIGSVRNLSAPRAQSARGRRVARAALASAAVKLPNGLNGVKLDGAPGNTVGGVAQSGGSVANVIAGNSGAGVVVSGAAATGNDIKGNSIGTDENNSPDLGNGSHGVLITAGAGQTNVGGSASQAANTIAENAGAGVRVDETGGTGNLAEGNRIYGNLGYGIDLGRRGTTPNDFGDADEGPNRLQNYPEITNVAVESGQLVVSYRLTSAPEHAAYGQLGIYVEFFQADERGEGKKFLGHDFYTAADFNNGSPVVKRVALGTPAALGVAADDPVTAAATDAADNTSEMAQPFSTRTLVVTKTDDTNDGACDSDCSLREALAAADAGNEIRFASPLFDTAQTITLAGSELVIDRSVKIEGPGAKLLTVSGDDRSRVFRVADGVTTTVVGLTVTRGNARGDFTGGGVLNAGTLTLVESHVKSNVADRGAGLYSTGSLTVRRSAVSANTSNGSASPAGAGIQSEDGATLVVTDSTVSGNTATVPDGAGGIYVVGGEATITDSTVANNSAPQGASNAGGVKNAGGTVTLAGSIVAGNAAADADLCGAFNSSGYNLVGKNDGAQSSFAAGFPNASHDLVGTGASPVNAMLDALGDYGGTTPTHRLQSNSPAIDQGRAFGESTDQRGLARPSDDPNVANAAGGDGSDIGAYETQIAVSNVVASISGRVTLDGSPLGGVTVTLTKPDNTTATTATDSGGAYSFAALAAGSYTVTPSRARFSFTPQSRAVVLNGTNVTDADFAASSTAEASGANGSVVISELRLSGVTSDDEYVELYNNTDSTVDIGGYRLEALAGQAVVVPAQTTLPARSHYLVAHAAGAGAGYSLAAYAAPDQTYSDFDLPTDTGLVLVSASGAIIDAVGFGSSPTPYREGTALASVQSSSQYAFVRRLSSGTPQDTGDNATDFVLVSTDPSAVPGSVLGAPGPENLASPINRGGRVKSSLPAPCAPASSAPNRSRDAAQYSDTATPSSPDGDGGAYTHGTLAIRRRFTNNTGQTLKGLRFRVVDITAGSPAAAGVADVRVLTSSDEEGVANPCGGALSTRGLSLERANNQPRGGGLNSTVASGYVKVNGLAPGDSVDLTFLLGVAETGSFRFLVIVEAAP